MPHKDDPELSTKNPPHIVASQWIELVAYWGSEDAKVVADRNSINRELRGPIHKTGRNHFAQIRYEMERDGEETDKFSVWKKTRDLEDVNVKEFIIQFEQFLSEETLEDQQNNIIKVKIFHSLMGDDGHGYCRTFCSSVPHSLIYAKEASSFQTADIIANITAQVHRQVQGEIDELRREVEQLKGKDKYFENHGSEPYIQQPNATSGHEIIRESIRDGEAPSVHCGRPLNPITAETSHSSQNGAQR